MSKHGHTVTDQPNVLFHWIGRARAGHWVGTRGKYFLIKYRDYPRPIETIAILPYNPLLEGLYWVDAERQTNEIAEAL